MLVAARSAVVEIGASARLNLFWERYCYEYESAARAPMVAGDLGSSVRIGCAVRGTARPPLGPDDLFATSVVRRIGVELDPISLDNPDDVAWLRGLVWPERRERASRLDHAMAIAQARHRLNFSIRRGDGAALLPTIAAELADGEALCVVQSFTLNQLSSEARLTLDRTLSDAAGKRGVLRLGLEWERRDAPVLSLTLYGGSGGKRRVSPAATPMAPGWNGWSSDCYTCIHVHR
jgi:hypothetical protein